LCPLGVGGTVCLDRPHADRARTGREGGTWFSLIDKVFALPTLQAALARVKANGGAAGVDHQTLAMVEARLDETLAD
jgi:hypothetical protein